MEEAGQSSGILRGQCVCVCPFLFIITRISPLKAAVQINSFFNLSIMKYRHQSFPECKVAPSNVLFCQV